MPNIFTIMTESSRGMQGLAMAQSPIDMPMAIANATQVLHSFQSSFFKLPD